MKSFQTLPPHYQGVLYIISGVIILLYALGLVGKGLGVIVIIAALYLIIAGCVKVELFKKLSSMMGRKKH